MGDFRTELIPVPSAFPINRKDKIFTIGSCFADSIGNHLLDNKFITWNNLLGTVYNPVSIHHVASLGIEKEFPSRETYLTNGGLHLNYHFHSSFSAVDKGELENKIQTCIQNAHSFLKTANRVIITYGTAFVYRLSRNNEIVANCHKTPSQGFIKALLREQEIIESFQSFFSKLRTINPAGKVILTVSPVRHLKDTLELNSVSKSTLRLSCYSIIRQFRDVEYFPAYEILLDDLRDYRFYKADRLHPTEEAVEYIWKKFVDSFLDEPTKKFIVDWQEIKKDLSHRPHHPQSESHQKFLKSVLTKLERLSSVDVDQEIQNLKSQILNVKP
jgi:hypothetical protein